MLPRLPNNDKIKKAQTISFGGINRQPNAPDGTIWWTRNMGSDRMPCLSPRKRRYYIGQYNECSGMFAYNGLYLVNDKTIYKDGVSIGTAKTNNEKKFAAFNDAVTNTDYILMWPDKQVITAEEEEASWQNGVFIEKVPIRLDRSFPFGDRIILNPAKNTDVNFSELGIIVGDTITVKFDGYATLNKTAQVKDIGPTYITFPKDTWTGISFGEYFTVTIIKGQPTDVKMRDVNAYFTDSISAVTTDIVAPDIFWADTPFAVGDTVTISGSTVAANNKQATIQSIASHSLRFTLGEFENANDQVITISKSHTTPADRVNDMEATASADDAKFIDYSSDSQGNVISSATEDWSADGFRVGDAVHITRPGYSYEPMIIREIYSDANGYCLRFDDETLVNTISGTEEITVARTVPDFDGLFEHEQRIWGWKGSTIYASKWNDPLNYEVFDGLESDSWTWNMDGTGDIVGAIVYQGYPTFFKQDKAVRIYGDRPSQYRAMDVTAMGIHPGCGKSLAIAGDTLYYVSRNGLAAYTGGYSKDIHVPFGEIQFTEAVAGSDGRRYFLSAYDGEWHLFVYDTVFDTWFREDGSQVLDFSCDKGNLFFLSSVRGIYKLLQLDGHAPTPPDYANREQAMNSEVIFNDFTGNYWTAGRGYGNPSRKGTSKIQLRVTLEEGTYLRVYIAFEGEEETLVKQLEAGEGKHSYYLPIIPRRSDNYKIILRGYGDWTLNSLVREEYSGSDIH